MSESYQMARVDRVGQYYTSIYQIYNYILYLSTYFECIS